MTTLRDDLGALRTVSAISIRDSAGGLRAVNTIQLRDGDNVLRTVSGSVGFSATLSPPLVEGYAYTPASPQITTGVAYATPEGGVAPYTVTWNLDAGWTAISPTSLSSAFRSPHCAADSSEIGTISATIEDANGLTATTNTINCAVYNTYAGP